MLRTHYRARSPLEQWAQAGRSTVRYYPQPLQGQQRQPVLALPSALARSAHTIASSSRVDHRGRRIASSRDPLQSHWQRAHCNAYYHATAALGFSSVSSAHPSFASSSAPSASDHIPGPQGRLYRDPDVSYPASKEDIAYSPGTWETIAESQDAHTTSESSPVQLFAIGAVVGSVLLGGIGWLIWQTYGQWKADVEGAALEQPANDSARGPSSTVAKQAPVFGLFGGRNRGCPC
ncbi:unnamed protein product [Mycena citricolor]|uniref:Uncharacterized protein n=1 Tax=Mycena citricolor TaxID=2018698 RepID=A0AAD2K4Y0_9AGAR|nr:unnamed protein product [Mycena citricolor]